MILILPLVFVFKRKIDSLPAIEGSGCKVVVEAFRSLTHISKLFRGAFNYRFDQQRAANDLPGGRNVRLVKGRNWGLRTTGHSHFLK